MQKQFDYVTKLDIKYKHLEIIDIPHIVRECTDKWFNQTLTKVNDYFIRKVIIEGEYHWHKHEEYDEFFFVLDGQLLIDLEDKTIELNPNQVVTITKGVLHRPRAPKKTVMLLAETSTAVEQLVRNYPTNGNSLEVGKPPASFILIIPVINPLKYLFYYTLCPVCLATVHFSKFHVESRLVQFLSCFLKKHRLLAVIG